MELQDLPEVYLPVNVELDTLVKRGVSIIPVQRQQPQISARTNKATISAQLEVCLFLSPMSTPNPVVVPVVTIQPTAGEIIQEVNDGVIPMDKFWVSCYKTGEPSVHTKIHVELDERDRNLVRLNPEDKGLDFGLLKERRSVCHNTNMPRSHWFSAAMC